MGKPAHAARYAALEALLAIERGEAAGHALDRALQGLADPRDRALATELAYGVSRRRQALDDELRPLLTRPLPALEPAVRAALRLGLYQLRHTDRVPAYAAVSGAVELAATRGRPAAGSLVNAVLRRAAAAPRPVGPPDDGSPEALAAAHAHPEWLVRRWWARLGPEATAALLRADNTPPAVTLRANALRGGGPALGRELAAAGIPCGPGRWLPEAVVLGHGTAPGSLDALRAGRCSVQGEASMLVGHVADPPAGALCLDVAAAPGGKATHLAERMGDAGTVVANDVSPARAARVAAAAERLGLAAVRTHVADARRLPEAFAGRCQVVVADVPCTGLGALAGRPDLRWNKQEGDIARLAAVQEEILAAAGRCVRPGGRLVYSTCTTEPEENEAVIAAFLAAFPEFEPEDLRGRLPAELAAQPAAAAGLVRLWPHVHGAGVQGSVEGSVEGSVQGSVQGSMEGFFIACLRRDGRAS